MEIKARLLLIIAIGMTPCIAYSQVGDISQVNYPGWIPSDRVIPALGIEASYDGSSSIWTYSYTLGNGIGAEQDILKLWLGFSAPETPATAVSAPAGWRGTYYDPNAGIPGVAFAANLPDDVGTSPNGPAAAQIPAGAAVAGFRIESPYPPGYARSYVRGFAPVPYLPDGFGDPTHVPHDTTNSQRGWTLGPTLYTEVLTPGDDGLTTDNFLGWMNISDFATILIDPAPIAIKFSVVGETVFPETFQAILNGVEVTDAFLPGPPDGADRVAVFRLGSSPLVEGLNVIQTSIEGIEGITGVRGPDIDVMRFRMDLNCSVPQTIVCPS